MSSSHQPLIVGLGGATREGSATERALTAALSLARSAGARTQAFGGRWLADLPIYRPEEPERNAAQRELIDAIRRADADRKSVV